jgi:hypothetical protein
MLASAQLPFQHEAIELALALHYERSGEIRRIFEPESPIRSAEIRKTLLAYVADAPLLRMQARAVAVTPDEREIALFTLLYKELSRGAYRDFVADLGLVSQESAREGPFWNLIQAETLPLGLFVHDQGSEDFGCPPVRETATRLAADPRNRHDQLCLAEFFRLKGFDGILLEERPPADELGGTPSLFPGAAYSRLELYQAIIADPATTPSDKAYALYRAVHCYAPSGYNSCGGRDVAVAQRRSWFQRLKKDYPASTWAKKLKYYW